MTSMMTGSGWVRGFAAVSVLAIAVATPAQAQEATHAFDIPAQPLSKAIAAFARQSRATVLAPSALTRGRASVAVKGAMPASEALRTLIGNAPLSVTQRGDGGFLVSARQGGSDPKDGASVDDGDTDIVDVIVTGSHIRGGESASPTIIIGQKQFKEEGFTDLGQVIRSIPQNFRGGQNPGVANGASLVDNTSANVSGGSALNLRGLGPDASLTLLNGRRMSYEGFSQAVDISAIPIDAVDRIEIVPDGASAIYGSDAVGGIANVILKRDFQGLTLGTLYADTTDGGLRRYDVNATAGIKWSSGSVIAGFVHSKQDPIFSDQRGYTQNVYRISTLYNGSNLNSGIISAHQRIGNTIDIGLTSTVAERDQIGYGATSSTVYYLNPYTTNSYSISPYATFNLPQGWRVGIGGAVSGDAVHYVSNRVVAGGVTPDSNGCYCNTNRSWDASVEGPLLSIAGGDVRIAAGIGGRRDSFRNESYISNTQQSGIQNSRFAYSELFIPLVGRNNDINSIDILSLNAAIRIEDYKTFGYVKTPKLGLIYSPISDVKMKISWGKSFKAPTLNQVYTNKFTYLFAARALGCVSCGSTDMAIMTFGGNESLKPERANTWSSTLEFRPSAVDGLNIDVTYFNIDYTDRVVRPINNRSASLSDSSVAAFVNRNPTQSDIASAIATYDDGFFNLVGATYDPTKVVAIVSSQYANVAKQKVQGVDLSGSYAFDIGRSRMELSGSVSWIDLRQKINQSQSLQIISGMLYRPAEWNGRAGTVWKFNKLSISTFGNYVSGVMNTLRSPAEEIDHFITFDSTVRYTIGDVERNNSAFEVLASVNNIFNQHPPTYTTITQIYPPFDGTNYSAIGRYMTISLRKSF